MAANPIYLYLFKMHTSIKIFIDSSFVQYIICWNIQLYIQIMQQGHSIPTVVELSILGFSGEQKILFSIGKRAGLHESIPATQFKLHRKCLGRSFVHSPKTFKKHTQKVFPSDVSHNWVTKRKTLPVWVYALMHNSKHCPFLPFHLLEFRITDIKAHHPWKCLN